jgi:catechol 2,3-dioxygenase-like lactoylglutathione lyase family enzyme
MPNARHQARPRSPDEASNDPDTRLSGVSFSGVAWRIVVRPAFRKSADLPPRSLRRWPSAFPSGGIGSGAPRVFRRRRFRAHRLRSRVPRLIHAERAATRQRQPGEHAPALVLGRSHHDAFHVSAAEFEAIFGRVKAKLKAIRSATPTGKSTPAGAGGFYFEDPDGHLLEVHDEAVAHLGRGQRTLARPLAAAHVGGPKRAGHRARGRGEPRRPMPLPSVRDASTSEAPTWPTKGTRSSPARRPGDPSM